MGTAIPRGPELETFAPFRSGQFEAKSDWTIRIHRAKPKQHIKFHARSFWRLGSAWVDQF